MCGHIDMENATTIMPKDKKDKQNPERRRRHGEEVDRNNVPKVIVQKTSPALGYFLSDECLFAWVIAKAQLAI